MNIRGNGLELQAIEPEDYEILRGVLRAPEVLPHLFGHPAKLAGVDFGAWLASADRNDFYFAVKQTPGLETAGICAYRGIDYRNGSVTVWAALAPEKTDLGVEVLRSLCFNAFDQMRMEHIAFTCLEDDRAAQRWAGEAGFTLDATLYSRIKKGCERHNLLLYSLLSDEGVQLHNGRKFKE